MRRLPLTSIHNDNSLKYYNVVAIFIHHVVCWRKQKKEQKTPEELYTKLNIFISSDKFLGLGEDKQLGQFFIEFDLSKGWAEHKVQIKNKLLNYLWFDVCQASYKSNVKMFDDSITCFSDLYDGFASDKKVFSDSLLALL